MKCGADVVLNPSKVNLKSEIAKLSDGLGCDVYIEATGHPSSVVQGLNCIARMGRFVEFSVFGKDVQADWSIISKKIVYDIWFLCTSMAFLGDTKELTIVGGHLGPGCWPKAIQMVASGKLPLEDIISHKLPMAEFEKGIEMVLSGKESIKIMLIP